jgi:hypothetical protein
MLDWVEVEAATREADFPPVPGMALDVVADRAA